MQESPYPPLADADWPAEIADMAAGFAGRLNVYRVMAHHPALLRACAGLREHIVRDTALGPLRSEVVILRAGHRLGAEYEWAHHIVRGRAAGLSDARIAALAGPVTAMAAEDAVLAGAVDALFDRHRLSAAEHGALAALVGTEGVFDLIATVGFYTTLGCILRSFDTPLDAHVAAELAARPLAP
jgi:4-carboxymuconolactone decarboxylase